MYVMGSQRGNQYNSFSWPHDKVVSCTLPELPSCYPIKMFVLLFGENLQAVAYSAVKKPPTPLTGEQYREIEPKYPEGSHCQSVLRSHVVFNIPLYF